ncbi:MAG: NifB/NifX family molybdenum-iron cluster-binding protein [Desulfobacca sp.]|uniref:NifB/NifX family molybdenum-iron cluster-binding protein n=1 Tax=Desulfobacca sp. TaxID=2067990 RepID=UPI00404B13FC
MKIAISSNGPSLQDRVDPRFGRAAGFVIVDLKTGASQYLDNGRGQMLGQGAGIQAAQTIARAGVQVLLTGQVGPKAFQALSAAGINIVQHMEGLTVGQALEEFKKLHVAVPSIQGGK